MNVLNNQVSKENLNLIILIRLYCFEQEIKQRLKMRKLDDNEKIGTFVAVKRNLIKKYKSLFQYDKLIEYLETKKLFKHAIIDCVKDKNEIIKHDKLDENDNLLKIIDELQKLDSKLVKTINETKININDFKEENQFETDYLNKNDSIIYFFGGLEFINPIIIDLLNIHLKIKPIMCQYCILGKYYMAIALIGVRKEFDVKIQLIKLKSLNKIEFYKTKYLFVSEIFNRKFNYNSFINYLKDIGIDRIKKDSKIKKGIIYEDTFINIYKIEKSDKINFVKEEEYYISLLTILSLYTNYKEIEKKLVYNNDEIENVYLVNHDTLQNLKDSLNFKELYDFIEFNFYTKNIALEFTDHNIIINSLINNIPKETKEKCRKIDKKYIKKNYFNIEPNLTSYNLDNNTTIFIYDNFEIMNKKLFKSIFPYIHMNGIDCLFIDGKIIIYFPDIFNQNKFITLLGKLEKNSKKFLLLYSFVYTNKNEQIDHMKSIIYNLDEFLENINPTTFPIKLKSGKIELIVIVNTKNVKNQKLTDNFKKRPKKGLKKIGNIECINAILQCFANIEVFVTFFKNNKITNTKTLSYSFKLLIDHLWPKNYLSEYEKTINYYDPEELIKKISVNESESIKYIINFILTQLHGELNMTNNNINNSNQFLNPTNKEIMFNNFIMNYSRYYNSIISDIFFFPVCYINECVSCGLKYYNYQVQQCLIFPLNEISKCKNNKKDININDCFDYFQEEYLINGDKFNNCDKCKKKAERKLYNKIVNTSDILILIFDKNEKDLDIKMKFDDFLLLDNYIEIKQTGFIYMLIGIIARYKENDKECYIALCRDPINKKWNKYIDDIAISGIDFNQEIKKFNTPSMLFYQKEN